MNEHDVELRYTLHGVPVVIIDDGGIYAHVHYRASDDTNDPHGPPFDVVNLWNYADGRRVDDAHERIVQKLDEYATDNDDLLVEIGW